MGRTFSSAAGCPLLAFIILLTLGFMAQVMIGALLQILPVVIGVTVPRPQLDRGADSSAADLGNLDAGGRFFDQQPARFPNRQRIAWPGIRGGADRVQSRGVACARDQRHGDRGALRLGRTASDRDSWVAAERIFRSGA